MAENARKEISALQAVLKCLSDFKLKSQFSSKSIIIRIGQLEKVRKGKKSSRKSPTKTTETHIKQSAGHTSANSENKECNNSCGQAVSSPPTPINLQAELQAGLKRSLTPPECQAEKRPRVEVSRPVTPPSSAPWPQPGPCSFGQATNVMPHVNSTWPRGPSPGSSSGSNPNFNVPNAMHGFAPPHPRNGQFVALHAYPAGAPLPIYDGNGGALVPPKMP